MAKQLENVKKDGVKREEILKKPLSAKDIYYYLDPEKGINQLSREVFKKEDKEIHYPIGFNGGSKYQKTKKFTYLGFKGNLPIGVNKAATKGLGFTKILKPIMDFLEDNFNIEEIIFKKMGKSSFSSNKKSITFSELDLERIYPVFKNNLDKQKQDNNILANENLHLLFPDNIKEGERKYISNSISSVLSSWEQSISEFSDGDKAAIKDLFDKLTLTKDFLNSETLLKTKETIDAKYIEDVIEQYIVLMKQTTETQSLEKKWQALLKEHNWIFSYIFSFPIILFEDEAYVGGKTLSNQNGKVTDFLVKNHLTENVAFIEIKTHKTSLLKKGKPYRGFDVYSMSSDLSGGISQVLNQRDNFQKHFAIHKLDTDEEFETFNSKCVVLMGLIKELNKSELRSFELLRSNSKDVEIITFDELLGRFKNLKALMSGKTTERNTRSTKKIKTDGAI